VVPFRSHAPDPKSPALSSVERSAFHELARQLTARLKGEDEEAADEAAAQAVQENTQPANNENAPQPAPAEPSEAVPPATAGDDRTEPEAAELRLAQAQMRELKSILDTATDGVVVIEPDGRVASCNRSAEALFGEDAAALTARNFADLFAPESRSVVLDYLASLGRGESPRSGGREVAGRMRQGGTLALFMTLGRIDDSQRVCAVFRDITPWKKAERELMAAKHDAEKASAAKSDFLAKISHEIRTPLNSIIGFSEVMIEERFGPIGNERYREYLGDIRSSGGHVVSLLNDLLDLSKIEAGKLDLAFASLDLNEVVQGCIALMQPQASRERIIIRTSLSPMLRPIVADARSVRQIVLNLLSNSIKFTGAGGQVIVSTAQTAAGEVVLRVRDTGIGMDTNELAVALEPFRQLATSARWGSSGTGLGLPLTKALTEANRASFGISSKLNDGTLIEIAFPPPRAPAA
jgi:PAS domain S-box-containing protein